MPMPKPDIRPIPPVRRSGWCIDTPRDDISRPALTAEPPKSIVRRTPKCSCTRPNTAAEAPKIIEARMPGKVVCSTGQSATAGATTPISLISVSESDSHANGAPTEKCN